MKRTFAAGAVAMLTTVGVVAQEPWEGVWAQTPGQCSAPDDDGFPLVILSAHSRVGIYTQWSANEEVESPEGNEGQIEFRRAADAYVCYIQKTTNLVMLPGWIFDTECGGEGEIWNARHVVLLPSAFPGEMGLFDGERLNTLYRCELGEQTGPASAPEHQR